MKIASPQLTVLIALGLVLACSQPQPADYSKKVTKKTNSAVKDSDASVDSGNDDPEDTNGDDSEPGDTQSPSPVSPAPTGMPSPSPVSPSPSPSPVSPAPAPTPTPTPAADAGAAATGSVTVGVTYVKPSTKGSHENRGHVRAVWITAVKDGKDVYVRTIESFGLVRSSNLQRFVYFTNQFSVDGVTQATKAYVANGLKDPTVTLTWDLKNQEGKVQSLGKYKVWFELSTGNTSDIDTSKIEQAQNIGGGYAFFVLPFDLTAASATVENKSNAVFTNIKVTHTK